MRFLQGRQHRPRYLAWMLTGLLLLVGGQWAVQVIAPPHGCGPGSREHVAEIVAAVNYALVLALALRAIIQRLHDLGLFGGWCWVLFAPPLVFWGARVAAAVLEQPMPALLHDVLQYAALLLPGGLALLALVPGQAAANRFGPAPPPPGARDRVILLGVILLLMLSAVLVAAPGHYTHRAAANVGYGMADPLRKQVTAFWREHGRLPGPTDLVTGPLPDAEGKGPVRGIELGPGGVVTLVYSGAGRMPPACEGRTWVFRPVPGNGTIEWDCTGGTLPAPLRPRHCRTTP